MHLVRSLVQAGDAERAHGLAFEVSAIGRIAPGDPTAQQLAGVAAEMLFSLAGWASGKLETTVKARDTVASWWRSQTMNAGLATYLESSFNRWAEDRSVTFGATDQTWAKLRSASLMSGFGADTPSWSNAVRLLAQYMLLGEPGPQQIEGAIDLLRISGASKQLKLAINRTLEYGPTDGLERVLTKLDLEKSTRSSIKNDLELIGRCASILVPNQADEIVMWLLAEIADPSARATRLRLQFLYVNHLVDVLSSVYVACTSTGRALTRAHASALPVIEDQSIAHAYAKLLGSVAVEDWANASIALFTARGEGDNFELRDGIERLVAQRDADYRLGLVERIATGDLSALASWGRVTDLPEHAAKGMIASLSDSLSRITASARTGAFGFGGALRARVG